MAHLIDKSALVAEIEKRIKINKECMLGFKNLDYYQGKVDALNDTISFINTLEVKEVEEKIPMWVREVQREEPFDDRWFIGMDDCLHRKGYKIKICDLWNLPKEPLNI